MRRRFSVTALFLFLLGCQKAAQTPVGVEDPIVRQTRHAGQNSQGARSYLVVEDSTAIIGGDHRTTEALGIETSRGVFTPLIEAGTMVPCSVTETFATSEDGQVQITLSVFRGNHPATSDDTALGRFQVINLPAGPPGAIVAEITFSVSSRQILISARDRVKKTDFEVRKVTADTKL
jgi:molecular chaperone DnaK (HSP70)